MYILYCNAPYVVQSHLHGTQHRMHARTHHVVPLVSYRVLRYYWGGFGVRFSLIFSAVGGVGGLES
jgi:hypothetical protein